MQSKTYVTQKQLIKLSSNNKKNSISMKIHIKKRLLLSGSLSLFLYLVKLSLITPAASIALAPLPFSQLLYR